MGVSDQKYRYRPNPQVSASQIAEYLGASPTRRKRIIRDARFPKTSVIAQYDGAREGLVNFLADDARSYKHLAEARDRLEKRKVRPGATDWLKRDSVGSIEAMDEFQSAYNKFGLSKYACAKLSGQRMILDGWPTKVSVNIDLLLRKPNMKGTDRIGGSLFLFSKGETSTKARAERCKIIAGLMYTYVGENFADDGDVDPSLCLALDVFQGTAHRPPGTFAAKLKHVGDACEEIAARWKTIQPPDDYDGPDF